LKLFSEVQDCESWEDGAVPSLHPKIKFGVLSNWCTRLSVKQVPCGKLVGSNPTTPTKKYGKVIVAAYNLVLKTSGTFVVWGSTPHLSAKLN